MSLLRLHCFSGFRSLGVRVQGFPSVYEGLEVDLNPWSVMCRLASSWNNTPQAIPRAAQVYHRDGHRQGSTCQTVMYNSATIHTHARTHARTYIHICICIYIYTHTHTHMYVDSGRGRLPMIFLCRLSWSLSFFLPIDIHVATWEPVET